MKISIKTIAVAGAALSLMASSAALAQPYGNARGHDRAPPRMEQRHDNGHHYKKGQRLDTRYQTSRYKVDYRRHHLRAPPRGYQWRHVDNNYVLAAVASGLIAEIIAAR